MLSNVQFKPWPTSNHVHAFIEAAGEIAQHGLVADDIAEVEVVVHSHLKPWCEPLDKRRRPHNAAAAGNSILFCVAKSLVHGELGLADVTAAGLRDAPAFAVAERTSYRLDDRIEGALVAVRMRDGRRLENRVETPLGHASRPVSDERLMTKFRDCCGHAASPLSSGTVEQLARMVFDLERLDDISRLTALAGGVGP